MPDGQRLLIHGGLVATPEGVQQTGVLVEGERIAAVGPNLDDVGAERFDAAGLLVLPGLIDVHVHVREPGAGHKEDWESATRAALAGGVTTILDMPNNDPPTATAERVREKLAIARQHGVCDYGVYLGATADNVGLAASLHAEIAGLKIYLGSTTGSLLTDDWGVLYAHLAATPPAIPIAVHAEDEQCLRAFAGTSADDHARNRPAICAELAVAHVVMAARAAGRGAHIAHASTAAEVRAIAAARADVPGLTCEVCPHHLYLTADDARRLGGWGKVNPPLRPGPDVASLWDALPFVDLLATDHAPHTRQEKGASFGIAPAGFPGLETLLPLALLAVREGRLSLDRMVELSATVPARVFGLAHKGSLAPGSHADILVVDPATTYTLSDDRLHSKAGWSPFGGWTVPGQVVRLWRRGELVVRAGTVDAEPGSGHQVRRG